MMETLLSVEHLVYPFEEEAGKAGLVRVEDLQSFSNPSKLLEKKGEMQAKSRLVDSTYIIKLLKIYQSELTLHYIYEYVPYSLSRYIHLHFLPEGGTDDHRRRVFLKRVSSELMMVISYLIRMKIEVDLCVSNLGFSKDDKLKLFMNAKCRMGHKTELSLAALYNSCKEKILDYIEQTVNTKQEHSAEEIPNFIIKGNKLVFPSRPRNQSHLDNQRAQEEYQSYGLPSFQSVGHLWLQSL